MIDRVVRYFGAGAAGGLLNSMVVWLFGSLGLSAALGVAIAPHLSPGWLYPRIVFPLKSDKGMGASIWDC